MSSLREENKRLKKENARLKRKIAELEKRIEKLEKLIIEPDNSDPPYFVRPNNKRRKKKGDNNKGHKGKTRSKPTEIDKEIKIDLCSCPNCSNPLKNPIEYVERYVEDIEPAKVIRKKYCIVKYWCNQCKKKVYGRPSDVLPNERFGLQLMLLVAFQRIIGLSFGKIKTLLCVQYGLKLTKGALINMEKKIANEFGEYYEQLRREIKEASDVNIDETSWRIEGKNNWLWVFVTKAITWYDIQGTRGSSAVKDTLGDEYDGVITSDFYPSYNRIKAKKQKCLYHLKKELEKVEARKGKTPLQFKRFAKKLRRLINDSVRAHKRSELKERQRRKERFMKRLTEIYSKKYTNKDCLRICKTLKKHEDSLFTFLEIEGIEWHNNKAERALRPFVVNRKISFGSRSDEGAKDRAILMSVSETVNKNNGNFFQFGTELISSKYQIPVP